MQIDKYLIGLIVFGVFILVGTLMITDINTNYSDVGVNMTTDKFSKVQGVANSIYNDSQNMKQDVLGLEADSTDTSSSLFKGAFSAITLVSNSFKIVGSTMEAVLIEIGLPSGYAMLFKNFALAAITILIVFAVIYLIFRIT